MRVPNATATAELTLGDLLDQDDLGLTIVVAPEGWADTPITGAHSIEIDHPARWLDRDWVMLTTGVHLSRDRDAQRRLVAELAEAGIAALGFGLDVVHREIPCGILEEAELIGFPIFTIPLRTPFRDVISAVYRATLSNEIRSSVRLTAIQRFLMDSFGEESPRSTVIQRLAALTDMQVAITSETGDVLLSTGRVPGAQIAAAVRRRPAATVPLELEDVHGLAFAMNEPTASDARWLVAVRTAGTPIHPLTRAAAQATLPLLTAMARLEESRRADDVAIRQATLETVLDAEDRNDAVLASARAAASGVDITEGVHGLVVKDPSGETDIIRMVARATTEFPGPRKPSLATIRGERLLVLVRAPIPDRVISERLVAGNPNVCVGVGRHVTDVFGVKQSFADAQLAIRAAVTGEPGSIVRYEDLDFGTVLLNEVPVDRLRQKLETWLAPLHEQPLVFDTVQVFFRCELDVTRTARCLGLHPNSVRYRLQRAEELLGARLRAPETIVAVRIALLASG